MMITFGGISYLIYNAKDTLRTSQIAFVGYIGFLAISILYLKGIFTHLNTLLSIPKSMIGFPRVSRLFFGIIYGFGNLLNLGGSLFWASKEVLCWFSALFSPKFLLGGKASRDGALRGHGRFLEPQFPFSWWTPFSPFWLGVFLRGGGFPHLGPLVSGRALRRWAPHISRVIRWVRGG